jgi:transglutaminase-like putative cysteine protease
MSARGFASAPAARRLRVDHETRYEYEDGVEIAHHLAHLSPRQTATQRVRDWALVIEPPPDVAASPGPTLHVAPGAQVQAGVHLSTDHWGNGRACFSHARVHDTLSVRSTFIAEVLPRPTPEPQRSPPWENVVARMGYRPGVAPIPATEFTLPTRLAGRDPALAMFARTAFRPGHPLLAAAIALMKDIHAHFVYAPASTSVTTPATESLAQRRGVCQDFAHVMIGAMRSIGLPARYVSGYLLTHPPPGRPRLIGADATHAWVEVWCPVNDWVALDPTNGIAVGQDHVTVAWGRDYADVAPLRGVIRGGGQVDPRVAVTVEPLDEATV